MFNLWRETMKQLRCTIIPTTQPDTLIIHVNVAIYMYMYLSSLVLCSFKSCSTQLLKLCSFANTLLRARYINGCIYTAVGPYICPHPITCVSFKVSSCATQHAYTCTCRSTSASLDWQSADSALWSSSDTVLISCAES